MSHPTLILSPRQTPDSHALWRAAADLGWDVERLAGWRVPDHLRTVAEPVLYVEALVAPTFAAELGLALAEPKADWLPRLPHGFRRRTVGLYPIDEARRLPGPVFVKPPNDKSFPAAVLASGADIPVWADSPHVLAAEPVEWQSEFRTFLPEGRVAAASVYLREGRLQREAGFAADEGELAEARAFAERVAAEVETPSAVVMDVGVIRGRGWAVVELNAAWAAGLYGCDPAAALAVIRRAQMLIRSG